MVWGTALKEIKKKERKNLPIIVDKFKSSAEMFSFDLSLTS